MSYPKAPKGTAAANFFRSLKAIEVEYAGHTHEGGQFHCPVHADENASFDVRIGRNGKPVWNCKPCLVRCGDSKTFAAELADAGVKWAGEEVAPDDVDWGESPAPSYAKGGTGRGSAGLGTLTNVYLYKLADGSPNFKVGRYEHDGRKTFRVYRWDRSLGGYAPGYGDVVRTPFKFEDFARWAATGKPVYLVEGEKAAEALLSRGRFATTFPGGADGKLPDGWTDWFGDFAEVRVWPDADEAGVISSVAKAKALKEAGVNVSVWGIDPKQASPKDDAYDAMERREVPRVLSKSDLADLRALSPLTVVTARPSVPSVSGPKPLVAAQPWSGGSESPGAAPAPSSSPYSVPLTVEPSTFGAEYLERHHTDSDGVLLLRFADGRFWLWESTHYRPLTEDEVRAIVRRHLDGAEETTPDGTVRPLRLKRNTVGELLDVVQARTLVSRHGAGELLPGSGGVPFRNGWLDVASGALEPLSPARDIRWIVPGDYEPDAAAPRAWFAFLDSLGWDKASEERRLLRQWFGYLLSGETKQQKALMLVGPARAGKGTLLGVMENMMGEGATGLDLSAFSTNFGLSPAIGKGLATVGDARFEIRTDKALIRRILSMVGEDTITVDRKHKDPLNVRLGARLVIATNELPAVIEASNAFSSRFLFLRLTETFLGREDLALRKRILDELPGIVRWALGGLKDLQDAGRFADTSEGKRLGKEMAEISNPIRVFIEEECALDPVAFVSTSTLHTEYALWAESKRYYIPPENVFARDLNAAFPDSQIRRGQKKAAGKNVRGFWGVRL